MQNTSNADLDVDVILAMMWKDDVREKKNLDGAFLEKKCFYGHLLQNDTDYSRQKRGSEMEVKNRQGYQRGGHVYNNEYNRNFPSRIDNHLRHDVGINDKSQKDLKEEIIGEVEKRIIFLVQSIKTQQIQNVTPQYQQQDAMMQQYHQQYQQMEQPIQQQRV